MSFYDSLQLFLSYTFQNYKSIFLDNSLIIIYQKIFLYLTQPINIQNQDIYILEQRAPKQKYVNSMGDAVGESGLQQINRYKSIVKKRIKNNEQIQEKKKQEEIKNLDNQCQNKENQKNSDSQIQQDQRSQNGQYQDQQNYHYRSYNRSSSNNTQNNFQNINYQGYEQLSSENQNSQDQIKMKRKPQTTRRINGQNQERSRNKRDQNFRQGDEYTTLAKCKSLLLNFYYLHEKSLKKSLINVQIINQRLVIISNSKQLQIEPEIVLQANQLKKLKQNIIKGYFYAGKLTVNNQIFSQKKVLQIFNGLLRYYSRYLKRFCAGPNKFNKKKKGQMTSIRFAFDYRLQQRKCKNPYKNQHQTFHLGGFQKLSCRFFKKVIYMIYMHKQLIKKTVKILPKKNQVQTKSANLNNNQEKFMKTIDIIIKKHFDYKQDKKSQGYKLQKLVNQHIKKQLQNPVFYKVLQKFLSYVQHSILIKKYEPKLSSIQYQIQKIKHQQTNRYCGQLLKQAPQPTKILNVFIENTFKNFNYNIEDKTYNEQQKYILQQIKKALQKDQYKQQVKFVKQVNNRNSEKDIYYQINFVHQAKMYIFMGGRYLIVSQFEDLAQYYEKQIQKILKNQIQQIQLSLSKNKKKSFVVVKKLQQESLDIQKMIKKSKIKNNLSKFNEFKQFITYSGWNQNQNATAYIYPQGLIKILDVQNPQQVNRLFQYLQVELQNYQEQQQMQRIYNQQYSIQNQNIYVESDMGNRYDNIMNENSNGDRIMHNRLGLTNNQSDYQDNFENSVRNFSDSN